MTVSVPPDGGWEVSPNAHGQSAGLILYDSDNPPRDDKGWPLYAVRLTDGAPACGNAKKGGGFCESPYRYHNGKCRVHGGPSPKGAAHGNWKHGQRSRYTRLPEGLRARVAHAVDDPELTHHRTSVALVDQLIEELLESYSFGANPETWKQVQRLVRKVETHNNAGDQLRAREAFEELKLIAERGDTVAQTALSITRLLEARRRHADSETRRGLSEAITFSYEGAYTFYMGLGTAARKHFGHDQERLTAFLDEVTAIAGEHGVRGSGAIDAAGEE